MRRIVVIGLALICVVALGSLAATREPRSAIIEAVTRTPTQVEVTNFPVVQTIAGAVNVGNLPAVQNVAGTVAVGNLPLDGNGNVRVADLVATAPATIRFVGFSDQTFLLPQTCCDRLPVFQMIRACATSFPGSRACDYLEMIRSIPPAPEFPVATPLIAMLGVGNSAYEVVGTCVHEDGAVNGCAGAGPFPVACCGF